MLLLLLLLPPPLLPPLLLQPVILRLLLPRRPAHLHRCLLFVILRILSCYRFVMLRRSTRGFGGSRLTG